MDQGGHTRKEKLPDYTLPPLNLSDFNNEPDKGQEKEPKAVPEDKCTTPDPIGSSSTVSDEKAAADKASMPPPLMPPEKTSTSTSGSSNGNVPAHEKSLMEKYSEGQDVTMSDLPPSSSSDETQPSTSKQAYAAEEASKKDIDKGSASKTHKTAPLNIKMNVPPVPQHPNIAMKPTPSVRTYEVSSSVIIDMLIDPFA